MVTDKVTVRRDGQGRTSFECLNRNKHKTKIQIFFLIKIP